MHALADTPEDSCIKLYFKYEITPQPLAKY